MKRGIIIFLLVILSSTIISAQNFTAYDEVILNLDISSSMEIIPIDSSYNVDKIKVNLFIYPEDNWQQNVIRLETTPEAEQYKDSFFFEWKNPKTDKLEFNVNTDVKVKNKVFPIRNKIKFPITNLPEQLIQYTQPTEKINSDDSRIIKLASTIAEGEDDLFKVIFKIANFTKNHINYDLKFAGEVKSALWILNNQNGVCGDFSSLFMALTRALNIPIKYVVGVAYTDFKDANEFVPHAWTEVYLPDVGWVPFDPTYGEYGYIDTSHIKLKESVDVDNPSVFYEWSGKNYNVNVEKLQFTGKIKQQIGTYVKPFSIKNEIQANKIDIGSYQLIKTTFKNLKDYYIADQVYLFAPAELNMISEPNQALFLEPNQEKTLYWLLQVNPKLSQGYTYTFPFTIKTLRNINYESQFEAIPGGESYTLQSLQNKIQQTVEEKQKTYSANVDLNCETQQKEIYTYEKFKADCVITNSGNQYLENLYICLNQDCNLIDLGIGQNKQLQFNTEIKKARSYIEIAAKNDLITKVEILNVKVLKTPKILIQNLDYPKELNFDQTFTLKFLAVKESSSEIQDIKIEFNNNFYPIENFDFQKQIMINNLKAYHFLEGENLLQVAVQYKDKKGKTYTTTETVTITLNKLNFWQRTITIFYHWFNKIL